MLLIEKISNIKKIYYKIIVILSLIISCGSIGTHYTDLLIFTQNGEVSLVEIINFTRITLNLLCFLILCFMIFMNMSKYRENNINPYLTFLIPLLYILSQIPGLFYTSNSLWNFLYVLSALNILIIMNLIILNFENDELYLIIFLTFILLALVFFISFKKDISNYLNEGHFFYGSINSLIGDSSYIRSSGTSRIALILLIIYSLFFGRFVRSKILQIVPLVILITSIFLYQSKATMGLLIIFIILNYLLFEKHTLTTLLKYLLIYLLLPILLVFSLLSIQKNKVENFEFETDIKVIQKKIRIFKGDQLRTTSGRIKDWKLIINNFDYNNNLFFGYGAQGDRFLINQTASNGLIYAFVSSGIFGLMFFLIFTLTSSIKLIRYLIFDKEKELIDYFSFLIIVIILIRSLVETSYSLFGVDLILFYTAFAFIQRNRNLK